MEREWGILIVVYLFLGGLSAGLLVISAIATLADPSRFAGIARAGALVAPWPVLAGTGILVLDLGQPFYFWKLLVAFEPRSPMWIGTWLLTLFSLVSLPYAACFLAPRSMPWMPAKRETCRRRLAGPGIVLGAGVGVYTGVLLGVLVARPLWNTPLLAQLFLVSAVSTAAALLLLLLRRDGSADERRVLARSDVALIVTEMAVLAWLLIDRQTAGAGPAQAVGVLSTGALAWIFWLGVVGLGLVAPAVMETVEMRGAARALPAAWLHRLAVAAPVLVLTGGFTLRWVIVFAGQ